MESFLPFRRRFSCRRFLPEPLSREIITTVLEAAIWAPTGGGIQPWRFLVVLDERRRQALATAALGQHFVGQAPAVIVVCALPEACARVYGQRGRDLYCLQDTAAATQNLLLAATSEGLASCWVGAFDEATVAGLLDLPPDWRPVALVPVGYPGEGPQNRSRRPLDEVTTWLE